MKRNTCVPSPCTEALGGLEGHRPGLGPGFAQLSSKAWDPQSGTLLLPPGRGLAQVVPGWPPIPDSNRVREDASASLECHVDSSKCPSVFLAPWQPCTPVPVKPRIAGVSSVP